MSTALATVEASPLDRDDFSDQRVDLIRQMFANGAPPLEFQLFIAVCRRTGLAPEHKQIYFIKRGGKWTIQTSIDGYRLIADRSRGYAGSDEPTFAGEGQLANGKAHPHKATVRVWKMVQGQRCPFSASARWDEYNAGINQWLTMPYTMLAKCAESLALRKAFPAELSGLYTGEEMEQAGREDGPSLDRSAARSAVVGVVDAETGEILGGGPEPLPLVTQHDLKRLHALAGEHGLDHDALHDLARARYGVASVKALRVDQCTPLEAWVHRYDATGWGIVLEFVRGMLAAEEGKALQAVATRIGQGGIDDDELRACFRRRQKALRAVA